MNRKTLRDLLILAAVIIIAAIGARILAGGETLDEYAKKNPQKSQVSERQGEAGSAQADKVAQSETYAEEDAAKSDMASASNDKTDERNDAAVASQTAGVTETDENVSTDSTTAAAAVTSITNADTEQVSAAAQPDADNSDTTPERIIYMDGFYYEPISNEVFKRISGISYPVDCTVQLDELRYVVLKYVDFNGETKNGELICNRSVAEDLTEIFYELYQADYRIESIKLVDEFGGDDTASMLANNTSCFNYRVVEGTTRLSNHAYGLAIDINPFYNPYITYKKDGSVSISPQGSEAYADRSLDFPYKIDENDLAYKLFKEHGFKWGGDWNNSKDYQHFEKK